MPIKETYTEEEPAIASYDYTDVEEGTGVVNYLGFNSRISGAWTRHLTRNSLAGYTITNQVITGTTYNFDLTAFNTPKTAKGTATLRFSWELQAGTAGYFNVYIQKVDVNNNVETFGEVVGHPETAPGVVDFRNHVYRIPLDETNFKAGDTLRLSMVYTGGTSLIGIDPANRTPTSYNPNWTAEWPTKLELFMPFRLEI